MRVFFRNITFVTIFTTYLLILAGSIVRTTGSGMGCPDWPKCFGQWIPPTEVSQLPTNYKEIFKVQGKEIADFDAFKTWIEYLNRLLGVVVGILMFLMLLSSFSYWKEDNLLIALSLFVFLLTGFQGWVGSVVVAKNLAEGVITLHMLIAIIIVLLLLYIGYRVRYKTQNLVLLSVDSFTFKLFVVIFILTFIQTILGTQVRESIDTIAKVFQEKQREQWIGKLGLSFYVHRSFSIFILVSHLYLVYIFVRKRTERVSKQLNIYTNILVGLVVLEIITGIAMAYAQIPAFLQPIHLILAILILGWQFVMFLQFTKKHLLQHSK